jgi:hypothetical protein
VKTRLTILFAVCSLAGCIAGNTVGAIDGGGNPDGASPGDSGPPDGGRNPDAGEPPDAGAPADSGRDAGGSDGGCGANTCGACQVGCIPKDTCLPNGTWQCGCDCSQLDGGASCTSAAQCTGTGSSVTSCPSSSWSCVGGNCEWACGPNPYTCDWDAGADCITCTDAALNACGCSGTFASVMVEQSTCPGVAQGEQWTLFSSSCTNVVASVGTVNKGSWSFVGGGYLVGTLAGTGSRLCFGEMLATGLIRAVFGCADCQVQLVFH